MHGVTFDEVKSCSGMLADMDGFSTAKNSPTEIAALVAAAVIAEDGSD